MEEGFVEFLVFCEAFHAMVSMAFLYSWILSFVFVIKPPDLLCLVLDLELLSKLAY